MDVGEIRRAQIDNIVCLIRWMFSILYWDEYTVRRVELTNLHVRDTPSPVTVIEIENVNVHEKIQHRSYGSGFLFFITFLLLGVLGWGWQKWFFVVYCSGTITTVFYSNPWRNPVRISSQRASGVLALHEDPAWKERGRIRIVMCATKISEDSMRYSNWIYKPVYTGFFFT